MIATILSDPVLREDAEQRRSAAQEREHALSLRVEAERKAEQGDTRPEGRQEQATRQRGKANQRATARRQEAAQEREKEKRRAARAESERLEASRRTAEFGEKVLNDRIPKERLKTVSAETDALRQKQKELTARDETRRLRDAAQRTKTERKAG